MMRIQTVKKIVKASLTVFSIVLLCSASVLAAELSLKATQVASDATVISIPLGLSYVSGEGISAFECVITYDDAFMSFVDTTITSNLITHQKIIATNRIAGNKLKILVYGLNNNQSDPNNVISAGTVLSVNFALSGIVADTQLDVRISEFLPSAPNAQAVTASFVNETVAVGTNFPTVAFTFPENQSVLSKTQTLLRGTVNNTTANEVLIRVMNNNGTEESNVAVSDGRFETTVTLAEEDNTIIAICDDNGSVGQDELCLTVDLSVLGTPQFTNTETHFPGSFRLEWTDESESGAVSYELEQGGGVAKHDVLSFNDVNNEVDGKIGTKACLLNGNNQYLRINNSDAWNICSSSATSWTIDFWVKRDGGGRVQTYLQQVGDVGTRWFIIYIEGYGFRFISSENYETIADTGYAGVINDNQWHHIALCRVGTGYAMYKDGQQVSYSESIGNVDINGYLYVGQRGNGEYFAKGSIDELRITSSNAFNAQPNADLSDTITPSLEPYSADSNTKLLLHFDEDMLDSSGGIKYETALTYYDIEETNDGVYTYRVRAMTVEGIASEYSDPITVTVDATPPTEPTITNSDTLINTLTYTLTGTKAADASAIAITGTNVTVENLTYPTDTTWSADLTFASDDTYVVSITADDLAGNTSSACEELITVDTTAPVILSLDENISSSVIGVGTIIIVTADCESNCSAEFKINGVTSYLDMTDLGDGIYRGEYTVETDDDITDTVINVKFTDIAGNSVERSTDTIFSIDTIPPVINQVTENSNGTVLKPGDEIRVHSNAEGGQSASFSIIGVVENLPMTEESVGTYAGTYTIQSGDDVTDGVVRVVLTDSIGNTRSQEANTFVNIDTVAPVITVTSHEDSQAITARSIILEGRVDDATVNNLQINGNEYGVTNQQFSVEIEFTVDGVNTIALSAVDAAGNESNYNFNLKLVLPPETPQFTNTETHFPGSFRLEWTDESESGAVSYELEQGGGVAKHDVLSFNDVNDEVDGKIGTKACLLNGNNQYLRINNSDAWNICSSSATNWTIDFWVKRDGGGRVQTYLQQVGDVGTRWFIIYIEGYGFRFLSSENYETIADTGYAGVINDNQWHHIALCRVETGYAMYKDGQQVSYSESIGNVDISGYLYVGQRGNGEFFAKGSIDELRITSSNAFNAQPNADLSDTITPSLEPYSADSNTKLLLHFDEDMLDSSGGIKYETALTYYDIEETNDGVYTYRVRAMTVEGIASEYSDPITVTVDATPPTEPTITNSDMLINTLTYTLTGTKAADASAIAITGTNVTVENLTYPTDTTWSADLTFASDDTYVISITADDLAGNTSSACEELITVDTTAPVIQVTTPANGSGTPQKTVAIQGSIDDLNVSYINLSVVSSGATENMIVVPNNGAFDFDYDLTKGLNTMVFTATDAAGNISTKEVQVSFTNTLPLVFIPVGNKAIGYDETLEFTVDILNRTQIHPELLSFRAENLPTGATFNTVTRVFSWTPTSDDSGLHENIRFIVADDHTQSTETIKVVVQNYDIDVDDFKTIMGNTMSNQIVIDDFTGDGFADMYFANVGENMLLVNNQDGTFSDETLFAGVGDSGNGVSACSIDVDNDGNKDIYVVNEDHNVFYHNNGDGTFTDQTVAVGLANNKFGVAAYAKDFNKDGFVDLFLTNNDSAALFLNNGDGTFSDATAASGLAANDQAEVACLVDIDGDQDCDIYVVNSGENKLYINNGNAVFTDETPAAGVGDSESNCTSKIYDFDYDGDLDIVVNNHSFDIYYSNNGSLSFSKAIFLKTTDASLASKETLFFDYDGDGDLDVLVVDKNSRFVSGLGNILYTNNGDGTFTDVTVQANLL